MSFKKNFRGADTYAMPATEKYRDEYDRIFRKGATSESCAHAWGAAAPSKHFTEVQVCTSCNIYRVWAMGGWELVDPEALNALERDRAPL